MGKTSSRPRKPTGKRGGGILIRVRWQDVADLLGLSIHTAKKYGIGKARKFNPRDLASVVAFYLKRRDRHA